MNLLGKVESFWKKAMMRGTAFSGAYGKLRMLYSLEDPWEMASDREQHRFARTNAQLRDFAPHFETILELGCGEGHQSVHLAWMSGQLYGVDLSEKAIARAQKRCPGAVFSVAEVEAISSLHPGTRFDLITACEVLYYARDLGSFLPTLQARTQRLYVSNYLPRAEKMREHFTGAGWQRLDDIRHGDTVWECVLWEAEDMR